MAVETRAFARAGLLGNPSDGYFGKIIAITIANFSARVVLEESKSLVIRPNSDARHRFDSIPDLMQKVRLYGYYGAVRLIKAAIVRFGDYCASRDIPVDRRNFTLSYDSDIPRQLGLGGSSAIVTAVLRGLMTFYEVDIPLESQPRLILDAEVDELGINAGLMDRVIQVYEGCVFMDLNREILEREGCGVYLRLDLKKQPDFYLAFRRDLSKISGNVLNEIRAAYEKKDRLVHEILSRIASLADEGKAALEAGDIDRFRQLMDENFDLRRRIMRISDSNMELIRKARACGASAKFAGSGGSIIGIVKDGAMYSRLEAELVKSGATVLRPILQG